MILRFKQDLCNTIFPSQMEVTDQDGNISTIRLIHGTNEVEASKQPDKFRLKEFKTGFANIIVEGESFYQTEITDKAIIAYLQKSPYWGKYIQEHDPLAESKAKSESLSKQVKIMMEVTTMEDNDLVALGYAALGRKALQFLKDKDINGLRLEVAAKTQEDPDFIYALQNDKTNADRLMLGLAFAKGVLIETEAGNSVSWGHNNAQLVKVGKGLLPIDAVLEHFDTAEGKEDKKVIFTKLKESANTPKSTPKATAKTEKDEEEEPAKGNTPKSTPKATSKKEDNTETPKGK